MTNAELRLIKTLLPRWINVTDIENPADPCCVLFEAGRAFERLTTQNVRVCEADTIGIDGDGI